MKELLKSPARRSGLGKKVVRIVVSLLRDILVMWVSDRLRPGARRG